MFFGLRVRFLFIYFLNFRIRRVARVLTRQELKPDSILDIRIGQEQRVKCAQTKLGDCDSCCNCRVCVFLSLCVRVCFECVGQRHFTCIPFSFAALTHTRASHALLRHTHPSSSRSLFLSPSLSFTLYLCCQHVKPTIYTNLKVQGTRPITIKTLSKSALKRSTKFCTYKPAVAPRVVLQQHEAQNALNQNFKQVQKCQ